MKGKDGNGSGQAKGWGLRPYPAWFCLDPSLPCMKGQIFLPHPRPLEPREAMPHPLKLYFSLIFPTSSIIFLMKPDDTKKINRLNALGFNGLMIVWEA